jgi:UDP-glucose 6-dehydrogenase
LKDFHRFTEIYENVHLNTVFLCAGRPEENQEDVDSRILKEALNRFNKERKI